MRRAFGSSRQKRDSCDRFSTHSHDNLLLTAHRPDTSPCRQQQRVAKRQNASRKQDQDRVALMMALQEKSRRVDALEAAKATKRRFH